MASGILPWGNPNTFLKELIGSELQVKLYDIYCLCQGYFYSKYCGSYVPKMADILVQFLM